MPTGSGLGRDVFLALAAVIWSDGKVTAEEAAALVAAARSCGLVGEDIDAIENATVDPSDLTSIGDLTLSHDEKKFVFGVAGILADVDGTVSHDENALIGTLGDALGLSAQDRAGANASADVKALAMKLRAARRG